MQYLYGVFPETGSHHSVQFPLFYQAQGEVTLTSCTNNPVGGNFSSECLQTQDCSDSINTNQTNISSSLLFSLDKTLFPNITTVCDAETHNKLSPTPHNLICGPTSVKEVIINSGASQGEY